MKRLFFISLFWLPLLSFSQGEQNFWYFGVGAGLDFNGGAPTLLTNGQITQTLQEGTAIQSDAAGNLLFYTDAQKVWNKNHTVMNNGTNLIGHYSSVQSSIIVPHPGIADQYYLFCTGAEKAKWGGAPGLSYSIIDMGQAGGNGAVTTKNVALKPDTVLEALTAVPHCNGRDYWVITHEMNSDSFYVYLVTDIGLVTTPFIYEIGSRHVIVTQGCMKASPDGSKLAVVNYRGTPSTTYNGFVEIFDFDNSTGVISNVVTSNSNMKSPYGTEFSPDNTKLYVSELGGVKGLYQWDLSSGNPATIVASQTTIHTGGGSASKGSAQLAPDGKIYIAHSDFSNPESLGVINNPNAAGAACNYVDNGFSLNGANIHYGLPNFYKPLAVSSSTPPTISTNDTCTGTPISFSLSSTSGIVSAEWDFGDGSPTDNNISTSHTYSTPGTYDVEVILTFSCSIDTVTQTVNIVNCSNVLSGTISGNNVSCFGADDGSVTAAGLNGQAGYTYLWSPGNQTDSTISGLAPGTYTVTITDQNNDTYTDSVTITEPDALIIDPINDITICSGDTATLSATVNGGNPNYNYNWNSGTGSGSSFSVNPSTDTRYTLSVTDQNNCEDTTSALVLVVAQLVAEAGNNVSICEGDSVQLNASGGSTYQWKGSGLSNSNIANPNASPATTTTYTLVVMSGTCPPAMDSVTVFVLPGITADAGNDTSICEGESANLNASGGGDYSWNTGASTQSISVTPTSTSTYTVYVSSGTCAPDSDLVTVIVNPAPVVDAGTAVEIQQGDNTTLNGTGTGTYSWSPATDLDDASSSTPVASPSQTTTYTLTLTDANGCSSEDTVTIFIESICDTDPVFVPTAFSPNGDGMNDELLPRGVCIEKLHFIVYDRWGEKVFETNSLNEAWNGTYRNNYLNTAVFNYFLNATLINGEQVILHGNVTLVR